MISEVIQWAALVWTAKIAYNSTRPLAVSDQYFLKDRDRWVARAYRMYRGRMTPEDRQWLDEQINKGNDDERPTGGV